MPSNYTRSRARLYRDDPGGQNESYPPRRIRSYVPYIAVAAVVIAIVVIVAVVVFKDPSGQASGLPTDTPSDMADATASPDINATETPSDSLGTDSPTDTAQGDTATLNPGDSSNPDDSASPNPDDSSQPDSSASAGPTNTPQPDDTTTPPPASGDALTPPEITGKANVSDTLSLRASASTTASVLTTISKDEDFTILAVSTKNAWLKVKYGEKTGYVLAKYVSIGTSGTDKVCTVSTNTVNVRSDASKSSDVIGKLKSGDTVIVTDKKTSSDGTWYKVTIGDTTGYIFSQNCRISSNN